MWLSERAASSAADSEPAAELGRVSIGGADASVVTGGESRGLKSLSFGGYTWRPSVGQNVLVIKCGDEGEVLAGVVQNGSGPAGMKNGEVYINCGGTFVYIKQNGSIELNGRVDVNGSLYLNGVQVTPVPFIV